MARSDLRSTNVVYYSRYAPGLGIQALIAGLCLVAPAAADVIQPGSDLWTTPSGGASFSFAETPIPAGFFGPGSDLFEGEATLVGSPWPLLLESAPEDIPPPKDRIAGSVVESSDQPMTGTFGDLSDSGVAGPIATTAVPDTVVARMDAVNLPVCGSSGTTRVQIRALRLVGTDFIQVTYNNGQWSELWEVRVGLSAYGQATGTMSIRLECLNVGGTYDAFLPIRPKFTFVQRLPDTGLTRVLDLGAAGEFVLTTLGGCWARVPHFVPGMCNSPCNCTDQVTDRFGSATSHHYGGFLAVYFHVVLPVVWFPPPIIPPDH